MQERHDRDGSERGQDNKQGSMEEYHHQLYRRPQISQGRRRLEISIKFMEMCSLQIEPQTSDNPKDKLCFRLEVNTHTHTRAWDSRGTNNNVTDDHVTSFPSAKQISSSRKVRHLLQNYGTKFNKSTQNIVRYNIKQH